MGNAKQASQKASKAAKNLIKQSGFREARSENDTVRLWENYREQALLWRALAIFQIPGTLIALIFALVMWNGRETFLQVPAKPLPGIYNAHEIPNEEFVSVATEFVNLIATYQASTAPRQFAQAEKYLVEPMLSKFRIEMMDKELEAIETTRRTQLYFVDPTKIEVLREGREFVVVTLVGDRTKLIAGEQLPEVTTQFRVTMKTIPRNTLNRYGIVISSVEATTTRRGE